MIPRIFKFALVGGLGAVINSSLLYIFTEFLKLYYLLSSIFAIECAIVIQFILNDLWTFRDRKSRNVRVIVTRLMKSNLWRTIGIFINILVLYILTEFFGVYYIISNLAGILCAFIFNYFFESRLTWR